MNDRETSGNKQNLRHKSIEVLTLETSTSGVPRKAGHQKTAHPNTRRYTTTKYARSTQGGKIPRHRGTLPRDILIAGKGYGKPLPVTVQKDLVHGPPATNNTPRVRGGTTGTACSTRARTSQEKNPARKNRVLSRPKSNPRIVEFLATEHKR